MRPRVSGFTLIELLVSMAVVAILGLLLVQIFSTSNTTLRHGSARYSLMNAARETVDRIAPLVVSANPDLAGGDPIISPNDTNPATRFEYVSSADLFGGGAFVAPVAPHYYRIDLQDVDGDGLNEVTLEEFDAAYAALETDPGGQLKRRFLGRSNQEVQITNFQFTLPDATDPSYVGIVIDVQGPVRRATGVTDTITFRLESAASIPFYGTRTTN